jgi:hypothetical protein
MRALFTTQPGSHWRPLVPFASALAQRGHRVAFATIPPYHEYIARSGVPCFPMGRADALGAGPLPFPGTLMPQHGE